jgi:hypothetical protein
MEVGRGGRETEEGRGGEMEEGRGGGWAEERKRRG